MTFSTNIFIGNRTDQIVVLYPDSDFVKHLVFFATFPTVRIPTSDSRLEEEYTRHTEENIHM